MILFTAGGVRFAVEASEVEEIRDGEERGCGMPQTEGFRADRFRPAGRAGSRKPGALLVLKPGEGARRTLGVTEVERMTSLPKVVPLPGLFRGAERQWYRGLLLLENEVVPLVRTRVLAAGHAPPGRTGMGMSEPMRRQMISDTRRFVTFPLGEERFALDSSQVTELVMPESASTHFRTPCSRWKGCWSAVARPFRSAIWARPLDMARSAAST